MKKFLFIELSEMGSAILAYPAMKALIKEYPGAELFFLIFAKNRASVDLLNIIPLENVLVVRVDGPFAFLSDMLKVVFRMRRERMDCVFDLELFTRITALLTYLSGAPIRVGFHRFCMEGLYRGNLHTHRIQYNFQQHISKSFLSFLRVLPYPEKDWPGLDGIIGEEEITPAFYRSTEPGRARMREKIQRIFPELGSEHRLIIFNPSAGEIPIRAWPVENFIELGNRLLSDPNLLIVLMGAETDRETTEEVFRALQHPRCLQLTGQTTLPELMDLFTISDLLITNDSGPGHFASMTPVPVFIFFGPETPRLYGPLGENTHILYADFPCSPCLSAYNHRHTPCRDNKCLKNISVDEVYARVRKQLAKTTR
ncbi:MAG: glycosyltransferase family 9 protein [Thermodesulfobacteriota bacterium]